MNIKHKKILLVLLAQFVLASPLNAQNTKGVTVTNFQVVIKSITSGMLGSDVPPGPGVIKGEKYVVIRMESNPIGAAPFCDKKNIVLNESDSLFNEQYSMLLSAYFNKSPLTLELREIEGVQAGEINHCELVAVGLER